MTHIRSANCSNAVGKIRKSELESSDYRCEFPNAYKIKKYMIYVFSETHSRRVFFYTFIFYFFFVIVKNLQYA